MTESQTQTVLQRRVTFKDAPEEAMKSQEYKVEIVWSNVAKFIIIHILALMGLWKVATGSVHAATIAFAIVTFFISAMVRKLQKLFWSSKLEIKC